MQLYVATCSKCIPRALHPTHVRGVLGATVESAGCVRDGRGAWPLWDTPRGMLGHQFAVTSECLCHEGCCCPCSHLKTAACTVRNDKAGGKLKASYIHSVADICYLSAQCLGERLGNKCCGCPAIALVGYRRIPDRNPDYCTACTVVDNNTEVRCPVASVRLHPLLHIPARMAGI